MKAHDTGACLAKDRKSRSRSTPAITATPPRALALELLPLRVFQAEVPTATHPLRNALSWKFGRQASRTEICAGAGKARLSAIAKRFTLKPLEDGLWKPTLLECEARGLPGLRVSMRPLHLTKEQTLHSYSHPRRSSRN